MSRSILIVDDNAGFRASARRVLEQDGYRVLAEAADGGTGVEATADLRPEIAIVDIQLPDIDGFEVARRISQADSPPAIVLVLQSGRGRLRLAGRGEPGQGLHRQGRALIEGTGGADLVIGLRRALIVIGLAAFALGLAVIPVVPSSDHSDSKVAQIAATLLIGWSFVGTGIYAWWRRPGNRIGSLMVLTGFFSFLFGFEASNSPESWSSAPCSRCWPTDSSSS